MASKNNTNDNPNTQLNDIQKKIFEVISKNDTDAFIHLITQYKGSINFVDDNGMTPLQHACCKGNKVAVQILLDMGADINFSQHGANYTPLHFAALSGNTEICRLLLDAGINPNALNCVSRTASQMAAFVGNHACVEAINNYIPKKQLACFTEKQGLQTEPCIPPEFLDAFHKFVVEVNLHPVRIVLNLQSLNLLKLLPGIRKSLELMCEKEIKKHCDVNELMAFKFHYLQWIISELMRCEGQSKAQRKDKITATNEEPGKHDFVEMFIKRVLKENKQGHLDYVEYTIRDCVREFPFRECTIFRQVVSQLATKDGDSALNVLRRAINGHRGFANEISYCNACGNEKPDKKCSKCKAVQYCDRECQRLHWFMHKKSCNRPISNAVNPTSTNETSIDVDELSQELTQLTTS